MSAREVTATLKAALKMAGLTKKQRPKLLSDNGPFYISAELQDWLKEHELSHTRGKPYHPMIQGKIERWHRSLKNRILLEHYYLPGDLEREIGKFVTHYNARRYHESLNNLTPEDVWCGRGQSILETTDAKSKRQPYNSENSCTWQRRLLNINTQSQKLTLFSYALCPNFPDDIHFGKQALYRFCVEGEHFVLG
jgi:hypothetical protein